MKTSLIAAVTIDGKIGLDSDHAADWTSKEDKQFFKALTTEIGTIVMGSKTFLSIGRTLPNRRNIVMTRNPDKIDNPDVELTSEQPAELLDRLQSENVNNVAICGGAQIYDQFMREQLVDELYITVEPFVFGAGLSLFQNTLETKLRLLDTQQLNSDSIVLHYEVLHD